MKLLFKECERFEDLFPFKKTQINLVQETLRSFKTDFVSLHTLQ